MVKEDKIMTLCQINQDKIKILRGAVSSVSSDTVSKILPNPEIPHPMLDFLPQQLNKYFFRVDYIS